MVMRLSCMTVHVHTTCAEFAARNPALLYPPPDYGNEMAGTLTADDGKREGKRPRLMRRLARRPVRSFPRRTLPLLDVEGLHRPPPRQNLDLSGPCRTVRLWTHSER